MWVHRLWFRVRATPSGEFDHPQRSPSDRDTFALLLSKNDFKICYSKNDNIWENFKALGNCEFYLFHFELVHEMLMLLNNHFDVIFESLDQSFLRFHVIHHDLTVFFVICLKKLFKIAYFEKMGIFSKIGYLKLLLLFSTVRLVPS